MTYFFRTPRFSPQNPSSPIVIAVGHRKRLTWFWSRLCPPYTIASSASGTLEKSYRICSQCPGRSWCVSCACCGRSLQNQWTKQWTSDLVFWLLVLDFFKGNKILKIKLFLLLSRGIIRILKTTVQYNRTFVDFIKINTLTIGQINFFLT